MNLKATLALIVLVALAGCRPEAPQWIASAPAGARPAAIALAGETVIPNGRLLTPRGRQYRVAPHPYGLILSPDGRVAVTANSGVRPFSISILEDVLGETPAVHQVPEGANTDADVLSAVFMGLAIAPDDRTLYVGGGQEGRVVLFDLQTRRRIGEIDANVPFGGRDYEDSYIGDLVLSADGGTLYAVDQTNFRLIVVDTRQRTIQASVAVGRYPFGITLTPDQSRVYVANVGQFEYALLEAEEEEEEEREDFGSTYPPFGYRSEEAEEGVDVEAYHAPGLGDPNALEAYSVWGIDVSSPAAPRVISKIKTGYLVGEERDGVETVGGASPNSLVSTNTRAYVSNGNNDVISVIDIQQDTVVSTIELRLDPRLDRLRGLIPFGLALSPDGTRLYVAEAGINAVGVVDTGSGEVLGHIPTGWFPSKLAVSPDGKQLVVANAKGHGSGPNGGPAFEAGPEGSYVGNLMFGYVNVLDIPPDEALAAETAQVVRNNFTFASVDRAAVRARAGNPVPLYPGERRSPIEHVVFITKENRTYDEVFGQIAGGQGEPSLARFGAGVTVRSRDGSRTVPEVDVMPNHHKLAREFAIGDNFYCDSDVSADGHRWLVGVYPNEWTETTVAASYGGGRRLRVNSTAPGMLSFVGSSGVIYPEDYNEAGSIWDHFDRFGIDFFNFGLGFEFAGASEEQAYKYTGVRLPINYPMPGPLFERTSRKFATYNTSIPDQFRADMFIEEFEERWMNGGEPMPQVVTMMLPNDHGSGERIDDGYPYFESYMADNDLALGRVVEYLSHTPYWEKMAIIVTEDDPQGGVDHVDAHRSVLMVISPYTKKGYVSSEHYSFGSIMKTIWHLTGVPYLNQYDAGATELADFFTDTPDATPYAAVAPDLRLFDPQKALDPLDEDFNWESLSESPEMDNVELMQAWAQENENRTSQQGN
ncbi:MAG: alkaline phosphatase family protein [Rhodothermales bacterium]